MFNSIDEKLESQEDDTKVSESTTSNNEVRYSPDEFYSTHKWELVREMDDGDWEF